MNGLLDNDTVALRALEPTDIDLLYKWENDTTLWTVSSNIAPYSKEMIANYLKNNSNDIYKTGELRLIVTLAPTGEAVGTVDFTSFDPINNHAELGLLIAPQFQGKGYGKQVLQLVKEHIAHLRGVIVRYQMDGKINARPQTPGHHRGSQKCGAVNGDFPLDIPLL